MSQLQVLFVACGLARQVLILRKKAVFFSFVTRQLFFRFLSQGKQRFLKQLREKGPVSAMFDRHHQFHLEHLEDRQLMAVNPLLLANGASLTNLTGPTQAPVAEAVAFVRPSDAFGNRAMKLHSVGVRERFEHGPAIFGQQPGAEFTLYILPTSQGTIDQL